MPCGCTALDIPQRSSVVTDSSVPAWHFAGTGMPVKEGALAQWCERFGETHRALWEFFAENAIRY
jgi:hypothetical protein